MATETCGVIVVEDANVPATPGQSVQLNAFGEVANRPLAHHVIDALRSAGARRIVVATSDAVAAEVESQLAPCDIGGRSLMYATESRRVDLAAGLRLAAPVVGDSPCIVHTASGLLGEPLLPHMERLRRDVPHAIAFIHQGYGTEHHLSAEALEMLHVAALRPESSAFSATGVWLLGPGALSCMAGSCPAQGTGIDLTSVADQMDEAGGLLDVLLVRAWRSYGGDAADLLELNRMALDNLQVEYRHAVRDGNQIEGRVLIDERASIRASVIVGPAVIGPDAQITDAYIGPYTSVGAGARIEGAEVERSIIAAGARIEHVGRIVGSLLGRDSRVFREFALPRGLRLRIGDGAEIALH